MLPLNTVELIVCFVIKQFGDYPVGFFAHFDKMLSGLKLIIQTDRNGNFSPFRKGVDHIKDIPSQKTFLVIVYMVLSAHKCLRFFHHI